MEIRVVGCAHLTVLAAVEVDGNSCVLLLVRFR